MLKDWIEVELGDACFTTSGGTPSRSKSEYYKGTIPWVKSGELNYGLILDTEEHISDEAVNNSSAKIFPEGTLLIALYGATIGKLAILGVPATTNQAICGIYKNELFETKFLFNYLFHKRQKLIEQGTGGAQPNISQTILKKLLLPLAPLPEQRAIAAKIEQLFSELDNGIANLKAAKSKLEIYRQAILKQAFEGELTIEWRKKKLLKIEDWEIYKLGELVKTIDGDRGKNYPKSHELLDSGFCLFLSTKNVRKGEFVFDENQFISDEKDKTLRGGKLEVNDVVITTRGTLGNVALYDERIKFKNMRVNSGMLILRVKDSNQLSQNFLMQFINSSIFFRQLKAKQSGTAQPQIPANVLREIEINLPSEVTEQTQIVQEIETRLSVCDKLNESIEQSLEKAQALRQSILKKAFEGKLLSQDELQTCRQQTDWEPAAKLLERIENKKNK
jgi:type I restriction enzyme S subunit